MANFYGGLGVGLYLGILIMFGGLLLTGYIDNDTCAKDVPITKLYRYDISNKSNSMLPSIVNTDTAIGVNITSYEDVREGNIVTYRASDGDLILHRIVKIIWLEGKPHYILKGDHNLIADDDLVTFGQLEKKIVKVEF